MSGLCVCRVRVRRARPLDAAARGALLRRTLLEHVATAWLLFLLQEVTLQCVLLCACVSYIFLCASGVQLALLVVCSALLVALLVYAQHLHLAEGLVQSMLCEEVGFVAEVCGGAGAQRGGALTISCSDGDDDDALHWQVIGTVSVSDDPWGGAGCRLRALAVSGAWRRRGVALSLSRASADWWAQHGWPRPLLAVANELQGAGRAVLSRAGFELTACGARPLLAGAMYLHEAHFVLHTREQRLKGQ